MTVYSASLHPVIIKRRKIRSVLAVFCKTIVSHLWAQSSVPGIRAINIKCICKRGAHPRARVSSSPDHAYLLLSRKREKSKISFLPHSRRNGPEMVRVCARVCVLGLECSFCSSWVRLNGWPAIRVARLLHDSQNHDLVWQSTVELQKV